ncbi:MAG TPA: hypothetical protein V6C97_36665 [Oculatellaceae cyanobacterium]
MANQWKAVHVFSNNKQGPVMIIDVDKIAFAQTVVKERDYNNSKPEPSILITFGNGATVEIAGHLEDFYNNVLMAKVNS